MVVETRRGRITLPAKVGGILRGHLFVPFHYGYWDEPDHARAANEVTLPEWDPVSKQPYYKYAAASLQKAQSPSIITKVADAAESAGAQLKEVAEGAKEIPATLKKALMSAEGRRPLSLYVGLLHQSELHLAEAFSNVAAHHRESPLFEGPRSGGIGLLRDLHDLWLAAAEVHLCYEAVRQAGRALHDKELVALCDRLGLQTDRQLAWLRTRIDQAAPQALTVT